MTVKSKTIGSSVVKKLVVISVLLLMFSVIGRGALATALDSEALPVFAYCQEADKLSSKATAAQWIEWDSASHPYLFTIDKGTSDGIELNNTVITKDGVAGYIFEVAEHTSKVRTLLDPEGLSPSLKTERTRELGLLSADHNENVYMLYLPPEYETLVGDVILTSGFDSLYPEGLLLGMVATDQLSEEKKEFVVQLCVDFSSLNEVWVLATIKE